MAYTAQNLVTDTLLDMGVIADEQTPSASQSVGALNRLNDLIAAWNLDPLAVFGANQYVIPLVAGQQVYTIGVGGNLNVPRPTLITQAFIRQNNIAVNQQTDFPLPILTNEQWATIPQKSYSATYPFLGVWFDNTYPLINAYVSPTPTSSNYSLVFWADGMNGTLTLQTVLSLPPGYQRALRLNLFMELADSYQIQIPQKTEQLAISSKAQLDRYNLQLNELSTGRPIYFDTTAGIVRTS